MSPRARHIGWIIVAVLAIGAVWAGYRFDLARYIMHLHNRMIAGG